MNIQNITIVKNEIRTLIFFNPLFKDLRSKQYIDPTPCSIIFRTFETLYNGICGRVRAPDGALDVTVPETDLYIIYMECCFIQTIIRKFEELNCNIHIKYVYTDLIVGSREPHRWGQSPIFCVRKTHKRVP